MSTVTRETGVLQSGRDRVGRTGQCRFVDAGAGMVGPGRRGTQSGTSSGWRSSGCWRACSGSKRPGRTSGRYAAPRMTSGCWAPTRCAAWVRSGALHGRGTGVRRSGCRGRGWARRDRCSVRGRASGAGHVPRQPAQAVLQGDRADRGRHPGPTREHTVAEQSRNYRYSTDHQVVIDADTRLVVAVGRPLPGNRNDCKAWELSGARPLSGRPLSSPTVDTGAQARSSRTAASAARTNFPLGRRGTTPPTAKSEPVSSTSSPA